MIPFPCQAYSSLQDTLTAHLVTQGHYSIQNDAIRTFKGIDLGLSIEAGDGRDAVHWPLSTATRVECRFQSTLPAMVSQNGK